MNKIRIKKKSALQEPLPELDSEEYFRDLLEADFLWREPELESDSDDLGEGDLRDLLDLLRWPRSSDW